MNENVLQLLKERYFLSTESSWEDMVKRVSSIYPPIRKYIENMEFIPSSPTLMNANTKGKRKGTLSSCFPMNIEDSIEGIFDALKECAIVTRNGGGVGLNFSKLRGSNESIAGLDNKNSSGVLPFIRMFNSMLDGITQSGARRGAAIALLDITHPDILDFIEAKQDYKDLRYNRFNFSIMIPDSFYEILLTNPNKQFCIKNVKNKVESILQDKNGLMYTYKMLWDKIVTLGHKSAEPGIFNKDIAHRRCTVTNVSDEVICNPCAEYTNISYSACSLGSINLMSIIKNNEIDWKYFGELIENATLFLNNTIDANYFPLEKIKDINIKIRPIGLGVMGFSNMLMKLKIPYNSKKAKELTYLIFKYLTLKSFKTSVDIAKKRGTYPAFDKKLFLSVNDRFFSEDIFDINIIQLKKDIEKYGIKNSSTTSIAPTGTLSYIANVSSGIEPVFSLGYIRKIELGEGKYREVFVGDRVFEQYIDENYPQHKIEIYKELTENNGSCQKSKYLTPEEKDIFKTAMDLTPQEHIDILGIVANNITLSVSKTINMPKDCLVEDIGGAYIEAWRQGVIGATVYRDGSREGILVSSNKKNEVDYILKTNAPKRPKKIEADIYQFVVKHIKYYTVVGLLHGEPYEIFCGLNHLNGELYIDKSVKHGIIEKVQRGKYILHADGKEYDLTNGHSDDIVEALNRQLSFSLRHGADISYIVSSLNKTKGDMNSFPKVLARTLKHYIKDGTTVAGDECPKCKGKLIFEEGCKKCTSCGMSFCG